MKRLAQTIHLRSEAISEYERLHEDAWPEVLEALRAANIRNYSIFRRGMVLFAYLEYHGSDWAADQARIAAAPRLQEWARVTGALQAPVEDGLEVAWVELNEVFHLA